ncbi:hypothetical protein BN2476_1240006 [Paraburkholderia piptadeniae]|jgi:hypothetical protein|uniref:Uncharacterized protein n=1 Tax=Paraburkholderia piptadeniae TaxID=1701573 RepID=A0A1N7SVY9_9BURK|nr:hypothetical protein BN2476_1240006 [Paraburkholderia piptadeniae]
MANVGVLFGFALETADAEEKLARLALATAASGVYKERLQTCARRSGSANKQAVRFPRPQTQNAMRTASAACHKAMMGYM